MHTFKPTFDLVGQLQSRSIAEIKTEPMLWSADYEFAKANGGPITREFLTFLDPDKHYIIDTRVHMLMEGWFPCIGGWHLDNMPRNTSNGQPNYKNPPFLSNHTIAVVDVGTNSLTEFLTTPVVLPDPPEDEPTTYGFWSPLINSTIKAGAVLSEMVENRTVIKFDTNTFHRGRPATGKGWRFFIRATTDTPQTAYNEIRTQVNTYIPVEAGW